MQGKRDLSDFVIANNRKPSDAVKGTVEWIVKKPWEPGCAYWLGEGHFGNGQRVLMLQSDIVYIGVAKGVAQSVGEKGRGDIPQEACVIKAGGHTVIALPLSAIGFEWPFSRRYVYDDGQRFHNIPNIIYRP